MAWWAFLFPAMHIDTLTTFRGSSDPRYRMDYIRVMFPVTWFCAERKNLWRVMLEDYATLNAASVKEVT